MAKNDNSSPSREEKQEKRERRREKKRTRREARRTAMSQFKPGLNELERQMEQANIDYQNKLLGSQSIYAGTGEALGDINKQYNKMTKPLPGELQGYLDQFSANIAPMGMPQGEVDAALNMYGTLGANSFGNLASADSRYAGYAASAGRENELSNRYTSLNLQQDYDDTIQQYNNQRMRIMDDIGLATKNEFDRMMKENAFNNLIEQLIGQQLSGGGGGRGHGNGNGGDGGGATYNNPTNPGAPATDTGVGGNEATNWQRKLQQLQRIVDSGDWSSLPPWLRPGTDWHDVKKPRRKYIARNIEWPQGPVYQGDYLSTLGRRGGAAIPYPGWYGDSPYGPGQGYNPGSPYA